MMYNCLAKIFPSSAFHPRSTSPLSVDDFRSVILLPELAVHLIMQDLSQDRATAIDTMLASIKYGNAQFRLDLEDEHACNLMISKAYHNIHAGKSDCDRQGIEQSGEGDVGRDKRKRVLRSMLPANVNTIEGGVDGPPNDSEEWKR